MKLKRFIQGLPLQEIRGSKEIEITGIGTDSRCIGPGNLFIARKGKQFDGNLFINQAIQNGAIAILTDIYNPFLGKVTQLIHPSPSELESILAFRFFQDASQELFVCGVTGTNGKTTTTYLIQHLLEQIGTPCGLISTVETVVGSRRVFSNCTTPDVISNHKFLREMVEKKCGAVSLEVSSHGLFQGRVDRIAFDVALFTNLSPDHLDYHSSMEDYCRAKSQLFSLLQNSPKQNKRAIVHSEDPYCDKVLQGYRGNTMTFGLNPRADLFADQICLAPDQTTFYAHFAGSSYLVQSPLIGRFNVLNLLGAFAVGLHLGYSLEQIAPLFSSFRAVPGRLERVGRGFHVPIFIDYAHTEDALSCVLKTLREISQGRVIVVFGAGGQRDKGRRKGLARAADKWADVAIITSDNPRKEDPEMICREILQGFSRPKFAHLEPDRKRAIGLAIELAKSGDVILVAGKGHERVQILGHRELPFDDREVALEKLLLLNQ